jgi:hypothetical protein
MQQPTNTQQPQQHQKTLSCIYQEQNRYKIYLKEPTAAAVALVSAVWRRAWWAWGFETPRLRPINAPHLGQVPRSPLPPPPPRSQRLLVPKGQLVWLLLIPGPCQIFR